MNKDEKSFLLLEQIGGIDEDILHECSSYYPALRRKKKTRNRLIILAAALLSVFSVVFLTVGGAMTVAVLDRVGISSQKGEARPQDDAPQASELYTEEQLRPLFFSGSPMIVFKTGENEYAAAPLDGRDYRTILSSAAEGGKRSGSESAAHGVWISRGNGEIFSPYLELTNGNIAYGELFDYRDEVIPGEALQRVLDRYDPND